MKNKTYLLNTLLAVVLGVWLLVCVVVKTFAPAVILPRLDVPNLVLISLAALLLDHFIAPGAKRCYICIPVFSVITFALLPLAVGLVTIIDACKLALLGGVVFTVTTWLFSSMVNRMASGKASKAAAVVSALGLYLAAQVFLGMFLY